MDISVQSDEKEIRLHVELRSKVIHDAVARGFGVDPHRVEFILFGEEPVGNPARLAARAPRKCGEGLMPIRCDAARFAVGLSVARNAAIAEHHLVLGQCTGFVREDVRDLPQLFLQGHRLRRRSSRPPRLRLLTRRWVIEAVEHLKVLMGVNNG